MIPALFRYYRFRFTHGRNRLITTWMLPLLALACIAVLVLY